MPAVVSVDDPQCVGGACCTLWMLVEWVWIILARLVIVVKWGQHRCDRVEGWGIFVFFIFLVEERALKSLFLSFGHK